MILPNVSLLRDIWVGNLSSTPAWKANIANRVLFNASDSIHGNELWATDGTPGGTILLKDIWDGLLTSSPALLGVLNNKMFFSASDGAVDGTELWVTDGTSGGTTMLMDIYPGGLSSSPGSFTGSMPTLVLNGLMYFTASDGTHGKELWVTDGTAGGTLMLKDIWSGNLQSDAAWLGTLNGKVYFTANDGAADGNELWVTDGTPAGTVLPKDIYPGSLSSATHGLGSSPTVINNKLLFIANDSVHGNELWATDGTSGGTSLLKDIWDGSLTSSPALLGVMNNKMFFSASDGAVDGTELWVTDGTSGGTTMLMDIYPGGLSSSPGSFTGSTPTLVLNGLMYFTASDGTHGKELWVTDGTAGGTLMLKDIWSGNLQSDAAWLGTLNGKVYFTANDGAADGNELWVTDGTPAGTVLLKDIYPGNLSSSTHGFGSSPTVINNKLLFIANDSIHGNELWATDGTPGGTILLKDIWDGSLTSSPAFLAISNGLVFFSASDGGAHGTELWMTDGTPAGTVMVEDIYQGALTSNPQNLTTLNGKLYLSAGDAAHGGEVWIVDPSPLPTNGDDLLRGGPTDDVIDALSGNDTIIGGAGNDTLVGGSGNDTLDGSAGTDTLVGGADDDTYVVDNAGDLVTENAGEGMDTVQTTLASYTLGPNVENLVFTDSATHIGFGNALANAMTGGAGSDTLVAHTAASLFAQEHDTLSGGAGDDTLYGEAADTLDGGPGFDVLQVINDFAMNLDLVASGIEYVVSGFGNDTYTASTASVAIEVYGGGGNDQITSGSGNDSLWAGVGNDTLVGNGGNDLLVGDLGADSLSGGSGIDRLYIDNEDTFIDGGADFDAAYIATGPGVSINLATTNIEWVADFAGGNDTIDGSGTTANLEIYAAGGTDSVTGGSGADFIWGEAGNDTLSGNGGNDILVGGTGSDRITGGPGTDALYGNSGNGGDSVLDTFVFTDNGGTDFVFDFEHGIDKLDMTNVTGVHSIADLTIANVGGHSHIAFGANLISVANMAGQITAGDFLFS